MPPQSTPGAVDSAPGWEDVTPSDLKKEAAKLQAAPPRKARATAGAIKPPSGGYLPDDTPEDFTSNAQGEGLYRMGSYDFTEGRASKPEIQVPFSKVKSALAAGYNLHRDETARFGADVNHQGEGPTLWEKAKNTFAAMTEPMPDTPLEGGFLQSAPAALNNVGKVPFNLVNRTIRGVVGLPGQVAGQVKGIAEGSPEALESFNPVAMAESEWKGFQQDRDTLGPAAALSNVFGDAGTFYLAGKAGRVIPKVREGYEAARTRLLSRPATGSGIKAVAARMASRLPTTRTEPVPEISATPAVPATPESPATTPAPAAPTNKPIATQNIPDAIGPTTLKMKGTKAHPVRPSAEQIASDPRLLYDLYAWAREEARKAGVEDGTAHANLVAELGLTEDELAAIEKEYTSPGAPGAKPVIAPNKGGAMTVGGKAPQEPFSMGGGESEDPLFDDYARLRRGGHTHEAIAEHHELTPEEEAAFRYRYAQKQYADFTRLVRKGRSVHDAADDLGLSDEERQLFQEAHIQQMLEEAEVSGGEDAGGEGATDQPPTTTARPPTRSSNGETATQRTPNEGGGVATLEATPEDEPAEEPKPPPAAASAGKPPAVTAPGTATAGAGEAPEGQPVPHGTEAHFPGMGIPVPIASKRKEGQDQGQIAPVPAVPVAAVPVAAGTTAAGATEPTVPATGAAPSEGPRGDGGQSLIPSTPLPVAGQTDAQESVDAKIAGFMKRAAMDAQGQSILDEMIENKENPGQIENKFWNDTYFKLPGNVQKRFQRMLKNVTGSEPGSYIGNDKDGNAITAKTWMDIASHPLFGTYLGDDPQHMEGTERGYAVLMREANRMLADVPSKAQRGNKKAPAAQLPPVAATPEPPPAVAPGPVAAPAPAAGIGKYATSEIRKLLEQAGEDPDITPKERGRINDWLKLPDDELLKTLEQEGATEQDLAEMEEQNAGREKAGKGTPAPQVEAPQAPDLGRLSLDDVRKIFDAASKHSNYQSHKAQYEKWAKLPDDELLKVIGEYGFNESLLEQGAESLGLHFPPPQPVPAASPVPAPSPVAAPTGGLPLPGSPELTKTLQDAGVNDPATARYVGRALQGKHISSPEQLDQLLKIISAIKRMDPKVANIAAAIEAAQYGGLPGLEAIASEAPDAGRNSPEVIERAKQVLDAVRKPAPPPKKPRGKKAKAAAPPQDDSDQAIDIAFARAADGRVKLGADPEALGKVLGSALYGKDKAEVITKELLQNAMDAIRKVKGLKEVTVAFDTHFHTITITDSGNGMTRRELETVFTDLGASGKRDDATASGGFGLAKAAPLMMSEKLTVTTISKEKGKFYRHTFQATPAELLKDGVEIKTEELAPHSGLQTGTVIESELDPEVRFHYAQKFAKKSRQSLRLPGKLIVKDASGWGDNSDDIPKMKRTSSTSVGGADLDIHISPADSTELGSYPYMEVDINNNGIYQFTHTMYPPQEATGVSIPKRVAIDIRATVPEGHDDYPFTANRESLRGPASREINSLITNKIIRDGITAQNKKIAGALDSLPTIKIGAIEIPILDSGKRLTPAELQALQSDPAVIDLAHTIYRLTRDAIAALDKANMPFHLSGLGKRIRRIGIVLSDKVHGVHISDPVDKGKAILFVNPFAGIEESSERAASLIWHTIKHELIHDNVKGHTEEFTTAEVAVSAALGRKHETRALDALEDVYGDLEAASTGEPGRVRADLDRALRIYAESRGRPEVTPDIFGGERLDRVLPTGDTEGIRDSREGTVSEEFRKWFGASKVVDKSGQPLVVYHGTRRDFQSFDPDAPRATPNVAEPGFYFSNHPAIAETYSGARDTGSNIMPVYLSLQNPLVLDFLDRRTNTPLPLYLPEGAIRKAQAKGHDGIIAKNASDRGGAGNPDTGPTDVYIAFSPEQIKSAIGNRGTYDPEDPNILLDAENAVGPVWHLKSERVIGDKMTGPMPGPDVLKMLQNNGVSPDELKWTGLDDYLPDAGRVTPDAVRDFISQNAIKVEEVTKGGGKRSEDLWIPEDSEEQYDPKDEQKVTKYAGYQEPGGENYREMLLTLPLPAQLPNGWSIVERNGKFSLIDRIGRQITARPTREAIEEAARTAAQNEGATYKSPHWDEPNVFVHLRMNDRVTPDGKRLLHVEENQSDWKQKLRQAVMDAKIMLANDLDFDTSKEAKAAAIAAVEKHFAFKNAREYHAEAKRRSLGVPDLPPDAPFDKTWHEVGMRRVIRYAAENGYDGVSWTGGDEQAQRYDLSKQISRVVYMPDGEDVTHGYLVATDLSGRKVLDEYVAETAIPDHIGKEAADRLAVKIDEWKGDTRTDLMPKYDEKAQQWVILDGNGDPLIDSGGDEVRFSEWAEDDAHEYIKFQAENNRRHAPAPELKGLDLKVGGEGMKGFYDKIIPDYLNKFGKKFGAKVEATKGSVGTLNASNVFEYDGPERTQPELSRIYKDIKDGNRQDTSLAEGTNFVNRSHLAPTIVQIAAEMGRGHSYSDAVASVLANSKALIDNFAKEFGGKSRQKKHRFTTFQYLPITPAMRDSVMKQGVSLFDSERAGNPRRPMPLPPGGKVRSRPGVVLREALPGAKEFQEKRYKNWMEMRRMERELVAADEDGAKLVSAQAELGRNPSLATIRRLDEEMKRIHDRRRSIKSYIYKLEEEHAALDSGLDPNVGEVRLDRDGNPTVYLNKTAMQMIRNVVRPGQADVVLKGQAMSVSEARWLTNKIIIGGANNGDEAQVFPGFLRLMDAAMRRSRSAGITVVGKMGQGTHSAIDTLREELIHRWQKVRSQDGRPETHLSEDKFLRLYHEMPRRAYDYLRENGYTGRTPREEVQVHVIEAAAKIMAGKWRRMGLTKQEAVNWLARYYEEVAQQHGVEAVLEVEHTYGVARDFQKALEKIYGPGEGPEPAGSGPGPKRPRAGGEPDAEPGRPLSSMERGGQGEAGGDAAGRPERGRVKQLSLYNPALDTPEFEEWFGESKVVDDTGAPRVVYHGTRASEDFTEFSMDGQPADEDEEATVTGSDATAFMGAHFAQEPHVANKFAAGSDWMKSRYWGGDDEKPRVMPVYLSIQNPKVFDSEQELRDLIYDGKISDEALLEHAMEGEGIDPIEDEEKAEEWYRQYDEDPVTRRIINDAILSRFPEGLESAVRDAHAELGQEARNILQTQGHDGVRYKNEVEGGTSWIAFSPEQIKSAIGNSGKFDPDDPNILASVDRAQAMETNVPVEMPTHPEFKEAVRNTPGAEITADGLVMKAVRYQTPEQEGERAIRTGVFYLPEGAANIRYYRRSKTGYGGTEKMGGETLLRRPLFVKGATGGKAPEAAYEAIKGKGSMKQLDRDVMSAVNAYALRSAPSLYQENIQNLLKKYGADPNMAWDIIKNSKKGNQLRYALQENVIAHAVRDAGYDSVLGFSKGKNGPRISELFDVREQTYPSNVLTPEIHEKFLETGQNILADIEKMPTAAADQKPTPQAPPLYHVTLTKNLKKINSKGLLRMQPTNWVEAGNKKRYGQGEVYGFENLGDAVRWAGKMDWEFHRTLGSGNVSIVKFDPGSKPWDVDNADPLGQAGAKGKWLKSESGVPASQILGSAPVTKDAIQRLIGDKEPELDFEEAGPGLSDAERRPLPKKPKQYTGTEEDGSGILADAEKMPADDEPEPLQSLKEQAKQRDPKISNAGKTANIDWSDLPRAGSTVDGLEVTDHIPNRSSIESSLSDPEVLDGVREIPLDAEWNAMPEKTFYAADDIRRSYALAEQIRQSGKIDPLIMRVENGEPDILEGQHRLAALQILGKKSFPALVVVENDPPDGSGILSDAEKTGDADKSNPGRRYNREAYKTPKAKYADNLSGDHAAPEPGSLPIPPKTVRLFHYTRGEGSLPSIREHGLLKSKGRGDDLSGDGPSAGIWASTKAPTTYELRDRPYVEFYASPDQISHNANYPDLWTKDPATGEYYKAKEFDQRMLDEWASGYNHVIMQGDVPTSQILAIHEPWMDHARHLLERWDDDGAEWLHDPKEVENFRKDRMPDIARALEYVQAVKGGVK